MNDKRERCLVCANKKTSAELLPIALLRPELLAHAKATSKSWSEDGAVCLSCLNDVRNAYVRGLMVKDLGDLDAVEQKVVQSMKDHELLSGNLNREFDDHLTPGQKVADKVAAFGGSWRFISLFGAFMVVWISINTFILVTGKAFDPYPFILLNLFLSMLAAIQAPVIMMSQNRQEERDRLRAENDYQVNLKAELEIRMIDEKIEHLMHNQWQRMLEIQYVQMEMIEGMHRHVMPSKKEA